MVPYECGESNLIRPIKRFLDWTVLFRLILGRNITVSSTYSVPEELVVGQASSLIPSDVVVNKKRLGSSSLETLVISIKL